MANNPFAALTRRTVFFSFDFDDMLKTWQVRNSGKFNKKSSYRDGAAFEKAKLQSDQAIRNWIRREMVGCSVTVVLIGTDTYKSKWVNFEIEESIKEDMGLVGVNIHKLRGGLLDSKNPTATAPVNPLYGHKMPATLRSLGTGVDEYAASRYKTHTWEPATSALRGFGQNDLSAWVNEAARIAGR